MGSNNGLMKIGEVAQKTGLSLRTIRYYEELELIAPLGRSNGGFRLYNRDVLSRIHLIQSLQNLEVSLIEIKTLMVLKKENKTKGEAERQVRANGGKHD